VNRYFLLVAERLNGVLKSSLSRGVHAEEHAPMAAEKEKAMMIHDAGTFVGSASTNTGMRSAIPMPTTMPMPLVIYSPAYHNLLMSMLITMVL
jgi:hypothetical protein